MMRKCFKSLNPPFLPGHLATPILDRPGELFLRAIYDVRLLVVDESHVTQVKADDVFDLLEVLVFQ